MKLFRMSFVVLLLAWTFHLQAIAQKVEFQNAHTMQAAQAISQLNLVGLPADSSVVVEVDELRVSVRKNKDGRVEHIGRYLFPLAIRQAHPSPVYDYIEYAFLNQKYQFVDNPFVYKDLNFLSGNWEGLKKVTDETPFGISVENRTHYRVTWQMTDGRNVEVVFPIDYDKLAMESRRDIENNLIRDLKRYKAVEPNTLPKVDKSSLVAVMGTPLSMVQGDIYLKKEVNRNLYVDNSTATPNWVWSREYPAESLANLFMTGSAFDVNAKIEITFMKYENIKETVELSLRDLLEYFRKNGCVMFWGAEQQNDTVVTGSLFVYNAAYGYDHVLVITCPIQNIGRRNGRMEAKANLFIPTTRVSNLFYEYTPGKSTKKVIR